MSDILELHEFFVEGGNRDTSHVLLHIAEPGTPEEKEKGYFFGLTEVTGGSLDHIGHVQRLIDDVQSAYYKHAEPGDTDAFERTIEQVNRRGHHILQFAGGETHCIVGALRGSQISLAYHGAPEAALLYHRAGALEYLDILGDGAEEGQDSRLFSSILQGELHTNDFFYAATPHVRNFFSPDRVTKLLTGRTNKQAVEHIQKVLGGLRDGSSYGGILFHIIPKDQAPRTGRPPIHITPSPGHMHPPARQDDGTKSAETNVRPRKAPGDPLFLSIMETLGRGIATACVLGFRLLKNIGMMIGRLAVNMIIILTNKGGQRATVMGDWRASLQRSIRRLRGLPLLTKLLGILAIAAILFLSGSAGLLQIREKKMAETRRTAQIQEAIRDKKDAADARIIYGDTASAYQLLVEAKGLLSQLGIDTPEKKRQEVALSADINTVLMKLRKWSVVHGDVLADLSTASPSAKATKLALLSGTLIAYGPKDAQLYQVDPLTKKIEIREHKTIPLLYAGNTPKEDDAVVFVSGDQSVAVYMKDSGSVTAKDISFPQKAVSLADLFVYNQKLFTLDTATNQIYKHAKTQTGYDRGTPWIKKTDDVHLDDAVSLAIDGDLYLATRGGKILKFTNGEMVSFTLSGMDPPLDAPEMIWTYNNVNNLYILEPANKRLIALDKSGKLIAQYSDPAWTGPTGMVVDEAKKTAYVLDANKIYKIGL